MIRYGFTIFLSAFLLFLVQPMIAKFILPWFGGTAAVWTTCMMYFQVVLLLGYLYAHLLRSAFRPRSAWLIHVSMLMIATVVAVWLRGVPPEFLKPNGVQGMTWGIVKLLTITVGLPFFLLSSTGSLVQAWHSTSHGGQTYRLYALSNFGSILALFCYPFVVERLLPLSGQTTMWTFGFVAFALLCAFSGIQTVNKNAWVHDDVSSRSSDSPHSVKWFQVASWGVLAMSASITMMATTNLMSQEVASIPFLWILPLALYLVSLIICFDRPSIYRRIVFVPLLIFATVLAVVVMQISNQLSLLPQVIGLAFVCFACSMGCHGELERMKPPAEHLTLFYLMTSIGGAAGGVFVVIVAPRVFVDIFEFHTGLILSVLCVVAAIVLEPARNKPGSRDGNAIGRWCTGIGGLVATTCVMCSVVYLIDSTFNPHLIDRKRNEYGQVKILEKNNYRAMINGRTEHGGQFVSGPERMKPTTYYTEGSGPGLAFKALANDPSRTNRPLRVGVVGLGTGSLVTSGGIHDEFWFYEINPIANEFARKYFSYLESSADRSHVLLGDGRIQMERQLEESGPLDFDILFLDAFTSDSIPAHLLTRESFDLYWKHLKPDGVLIAHVTNLFVDIRPVVHSVAVEAGFDPILIEKSHKVEVHGSGEPRNVEIEQYDSRWIMITSNDAVKNFPDVQQASLKWPEDMPKIVWTDDFTSLAQVVDWSFGIKWKQDQFSARNHSDGEGF